MKDVINIGFSDKTKRYYLWHKDERIDCYICKQMIPLQFILNTQHNKLYKCVEQHSYCHSCYQKIKKRLDGTHTLVLIEGEIPKGTFPVLPNALLTDVGGPTTGHTIGGPILSDDDLQKEDASKLNFAGCKVAFDPERNKQVDYKEYKPREDKLVGLDEALKDIKNQKPAIPHTEKKRIEQKKSL